MDVGRHHHSSPITDHALPGSEPGEPPLEKTPLRLPAGEGEGSLVGRTGFLHLSQPAAEIRPRCVRKAVINEIAAREYCLNQYEPGRRSVAHCHRYRAVEIHDGRRFDAC